MRYGLVDTTPVPRVFFTERAGPIPLSSLEAVAGHVNPQTAAPEEGAPLPHQVFEEAPGVQPNPPLYGPPLAEEIYGPSAIPADTVTQSAMPVAKEGEGGAGITADTGLYSYDLEGRSDEEEPDEAAVAKELAAFHRFERARRKSGEWRDFRFGAVDPLAARLLNEAGRAAVRKDALVVVAPDCCGGECCQGGCCGGASGCQCGPGEVAKAGDSSATPKGRKRKHWPGWDLDLTTAEHWAPKVTAAILAALPASRLDDIARDYLTAYPPADAEGMGKWDLNGQATDWLRQHAPDLSVAILALVAGILADSYLIGAASAAAMTGSGKVDMGGWQPGDTAAAQDGTAGLGLGDDYDDTTDSQTQGTADQIAGGFLAALGRALATGQQQGATPGTLGGVLRQAISDHGLAAGLVGTVITAISSLAAKAWYRLTAVQQGFWQTADDGRVCPTCQQNEDAGPLPMGDAYPSGDTEPPAHSRCRCALIPA